MAEKAVINLSTGLEDAERRIPTSTRLRQTERVRRAR